MTAPAGFEGARFRRGGVIRTIWTLAGPRRSILARSIAYKAHQAIFQAIPVGILVFVIERVRDDRLSSEALLWSTVGIVGCVVGQWVAGFFANRSAWVATFELFGDLRVRGLDHLRRLPMSYHETRKSGDTVTAMTQDMTMVETFTHEPMQQLIGATVAPVVVFVVLLFQDARMAAATMTSVVLSIPVFLWTNRAFRHLAAIRQQKQAEASSRMIEYVQGLPVIRSFRLTGERLERFREALDEYRAINTKLAVQLAPLGMTFLATVFLGIPCVLFFGAMWLVGGVIDPGTFIVFSILALRVYQPLAAATESFESLRLADASLDRLARLFDAEEQTEPAQPVASPGRSCTVTFEDVSFSYDQVDLAVDHVSFTARSGETTAIVGPSGSGKSTLLQLIARFRDPEGGSVRLGGRDVRTLTSEQIFDAVTFVFQDVYLFPGTIFENIAFGRANARPSDVVAAARAARAHDFIEALPDGYDTQVGESGALLSGGERQRISIARAILKDAPVVLLDEPTSALDATNERQLQLALAELVRDKTVLVVAHRLSTIQSADQILVLRDGRVVERGTHEPLLELGGLYHRLWTERERAARWRLDARTEGTAEEPPSAP